MVAASRLTAAELGLALEELDPLDVALAREAARDLGDEAAGAPIDLADRGPELSGEGRLLLALLAGAVEDYLAQAPPDPWRLRGVAWQRWQRAHRSARLFLFGDSETLAWCCHAAGVDAAALRSRLRARSKSQR